MNSATTPQPRRRLAPRPVATLEAYDNTAELLEDILGDRGTGAWLSGGDVDADWRRAESSGEETVGGSVATPDQDVVDEIGHALGVERPVDAALVTSDEILRARDRHYWHLERLASLEDER